MKVSHLALALSALFTAHAHANFSQVVIFGDSLSDTGRLKDMITQVNPAAVGALQPSFTTNPDPVWASVLAQSYQAQALANTSTNPQGTNYAVAGARSGDVVNSYGVSIPTTNQQIISHLASTGGKADPNALYAVWIGANDLLAAAAAPSQAQATIVSAAQNTVKDVLTLNQSGANTILVPNIPDISLTPKAIVGGAAVQAQANLATTLYNGAVFGALNNTNANVIPANTFALLQEATSNAAAFGFNNTTGVACLSPSGSAFSALMCTTATLAESGANETYAFADDIHPSGRTHRILAQYYRSLMDTPAQYAKLPSNILKTGAEHDRQLYRQLDRFDGQSHQVWADMYAGSDSDPLTQVGLDIAGQNSHTGAYVSHQKQDDSLGATTQSDIQSVGMGVYHRHDIGNIRLKANVGVDRLDIDTARHVAWDGAPRTHNANTHGRRFYGGLQVGYGMDVNHLQVRPYVGVNAQKVRIDDMTESGPTLSTAMRIHQQERKSLQGELGLDVQYAMSDKTKVSGGIGYAHEFKDDEQIVTASLPSVREYTKGFNTTVSVGNQHATTAHLGIQTQFGKAHLGAGIHATHQAGDTDVGGRLGVGFDF